MQVIPSLIRLDLSSDQQPDAMVKVVEPPTVHRHRQGLRAGHVGRLEVTGPLDGGSPETGQHGTKPDERLREIASKANGPSVAETRLAVDLVERIQAMPSQFGYVDECPERVVKVPVGFVVGGIPR